MNLLQTNSMEEKKAEISRYLRTHVSGIITPLMEEIVKKRPADIMLFVKQYAEKMIESRQKNNEKSDSEEDENDAEADALERKLKERMDKKKDGKPASVRQGISAEVYGVHNQKQAFVPRVVKKDQATKGSIKALLKKSVLFKQLGDEDMNIVLDAVTVEQKTKDSFVIKEGEQGDILYIVGSGEYPCTKVINGKQTFLKTYVTGQSFGELALMYNAPRAATIKCSKVGVIYGLDRQTFKHIIEEASNKRRGKFQAILSKVEILSQIDPYEKEQLCDILIEESYAAGSEVVKEGEEGDKFYMVADGKLIAEKQGKKVFQFKEGDYFGEIALIRDAPRQATVRCVTNSKILSIERAAFKRILGPIEQILKRNEDKYKLFMNKE